MTKRKYDFAGWVTKNDILCSDGVVIRHDAFKDNDGSKVPLVWNHNYSAANNVLGHVVLQHNDNGVYGYGYLNDSDEANHARELVRHGDISAMSIGARKLKKSGQNIVHGMIYEVSLVLAGANPGALIEHVMTHSDSGDELDPEQAIIHTGNVIHSIESLPDKEEETQVPQDELQHAKTTIGDVLETLNEEQMDAVTALIANIIDEDDDEGEDDSMKQNVFSNYDEQEYLTHAEAGEILSDAQRLGSLKESMLQHGINSIEMLFPEADHSTNGNTPIIYRDPNTQYTKILNGVSKSPFTNVRTLVADLTEDEARAKGYIKGNMKKEEFFSLIKRSTGPCTVYKKQKLDRDDVIDITDFDVVEFMRKEMRFMLEEEIARAILVGDGRDIADEDKIDETRIRPIVTDHEFFTIQAKYTNAEDFVEGVIDAMADYRGSGNPTLFINHKLLSQIKLLKGTDGRYLTGSIPSNAELATQMGVGEIVATSFMGTGQAVIVNLRDYQLGASKGGQITNFDDFDIDYNQYKYLIETRLSGALTQPKSAIHFSTEVVTGADAAKGGVVYGERQADKVTEPQG